MDNNTAQETIERNETFLKITVSKFMRRCGQENRSGIVSREDLLQELILCFLSEVERYGEETARTHRLSLFHSMYQAIMTAYPLSVPKRSGGFKKITENPMQIESWEDMQSIIKQADPTDDIINQIDTAAMLEELLPTDKQMIQWRMEGMTQREIGKRIGLSDKQMCMEMKRIRRQLEQT